MRPSPQAFDAAARILADTIEIDDRAKMLANVREVAARYPGEFVDSYVDDVMRAWDYAHEVITNPNT